ncbi:hypothetical protein XANCAGTX0491_002425 [Xanthoria calcicola]
MFNPSPQQTLKRYDFFLTVFIGDQQALAKAMTYEYHGTQRTTPEQGIVGPLWRSQLGTSMEGVVDGFEVTYLLRPSMISPGGILTVTGNARGDSTVMDLKKDSM